MFLNLSVLYRCLYIKESGENLFLRKIFLALRIYLVTKCDYAIGSASSETTSSDSSFSPSRLIKIDVQPEKIK